MNNCTHYFVSSLVFSALLIGGLGCATNNQSMEEHEPIVPTAVEEAMFKDISGTVAPENVGESILEKLETLDSLPAEHMTGGTFPKTEKKPLVEGY